MNCKTRKNKRADSLRAAIICICLIALLMCLLGLGKAVYQSTLRENAETGDEMVISAPDGKIEADDGGI